LDYGEFTKDEIVIDAYCGVGTIGMVVSPYVKQVIGVESNKQSVINGVENLRLNHLNNLQLINDDATLFLEKTAKTDRPVDAIILDPPRSGSTEKFLKAILAIKPKKVIYVSCEAKTLARDLRLLINDYAIKKVAIVDMFVGTYHIETVSLLSLK
jgi:23S rRNA (uracil1939-C5)-methyltransferase